MEKPNIQKPKRLYKYYKKKKYKRRLERLANSAGCYPCGACRVNSEGCWVDDPQETVYIKRCYRSRRKSKFLKHLGNRKVRRYKGFIPSGSGYRKVFDYWLELT